MHRAPRIIATISSRSRRAPIFRKKEAVPRSVTPSREDTKETRRQPSKPQPIERERNISILRRGSPRAQRLALKYAQG